MGQYCQKNVKTEGGVVGESEKDYKEGIAIKELVVFKVGKGGLFCTLWLGFRTKMKIDILRIIDLFSKDFYFHKSFLNVLLMFLAIYPNQ